MRAFLWFLAAITTALLIAAVLAYPVYELIHPWQTHWRFDKIASRLFDALLLGCIFFVLKRLQLKGRSAWGWEVAAPKGARQFAIGITLGIVTMACVTAAMIAIGARPLNPALDGAMLRSALMAGLGSGIVVGLLEETLFRGLIQGATTRHSHRATIGIIAVALLFSGLHFLANVKIAHEEVTPWSGLTLLTSTFVDFAHPTRVLDAFLALLGVGILTGIAREWTGNILFAAGLHAGWVLVMRTTIGITQLPRSAASAWLLSEHDGYTGWLVVFFILGFLALGNMVQRPLRAALHVD
jgi:hypothetical protein